MLVGQRRAFWMAATVLIGACGQSQPDIRPLAVDAVVMAYGDSLTFGIGAAKASSYPAELQRLLDRKVVNAGVPGETSAAGLERLATALATHNPDLVVLCHGGNDILRRRPMLELADNLGAMIDLIRQHQADVVMLGVPGRNLTMHTAPVYARVADGLEVPLNTEILSSIMKKTALKSDQVHFNAAGYAAMARAVRQLISDSGGLP